MTTDTTRTNGEVASALGLSKSGVSRLRSGDRLPSLALMQRIEKAYGWTVQAQSDSRAKGSWTQDFNDALCTEKLGRDQYGPVTVDVPEGGGAA